ncbi:MAG: tetratricopeptide repeat protein [Kofleriaceae bacterium]
MQLGRAILAAEPSRTVRLSFVVCAALAACGPAPARGPMPPLTGEAYAAYLAGRMAVHRDDWAAAADALAEAATAAPDQPVIAVELARAQHRARRTDAAGATLATARARWPDHPQVWLVSGELLAATAPAEARRAFVRAIELAPDDERAYLGLAALQPPGDALATLRRLVAANPDAIDGRYRFGQRLANARELPAAIRELRAVLERDPDHIDARLDLARLLRWQGQIAEAVAQTRSAFDRSGQALDVAEELFWVLCEADDRTAAIDLLTLLDDERSDLEALGTVARLERSLGRIDDARAIAARIAKLDADAGAIALAELELDAGDPAGAARRALGIASSSERFVDARRLAASALLAAGEPGRALDALGPARATKPDHAELATLAGYALVELGRSTELAGVLDPLGDQPAARFARARVAERAGDTARGGRTGETQAPPDPKDAAKNNPPQLTPLNP